MRWLIPKQDPEDYDVVLSESVVLGDGLALQEDSAGRAELASSSNTGSDIPIITLEDNAVGGSGICQFNAELFNNNTEVFTFANNTVQVLQPSWAYAALRIIYLDAGDFDLEAQIYSTTPRGLIKQWRGNGVDAANGWELGYEVTLNGSLLCEPGPLTVELTVSGDMTIAQLNLMVIRWGGFTGTYT